MKEVKGSSSRIATSPLFPSSSSFLASQEQTCRCIHITQANDELKNATTCKRLSQHHSISPVPANLANIASNPIVLTGSSSSSSSLGGCRIQGAGRLPTSFSIPQILNFFRWQGTN
jgi:hypothetical protein